MFDLKYVGELLKELGFVSIELGFYERDGMVVQITKRPAFILGGVFIRVGTWEPDGVTIKFLAPQLYTMDEADFRWAIDTCEILYRHHSAKLSA